VKELWIELNESISGDLKSSFLKSAAKVCDAILVNAKDVESTKKIGAKVVACSGNADIGLLSTLDENKVRDFKKNGKAIALKITIKGREDEETAVNSAKLSCDYIIIHCPDWKIIPLENLIAKLRGKSKLLAEVSSAKEAKLVMETLELGADGVLLKTSDLDELMETVVIVKEKTLKIDLIAAKIVNLKEIGTGARVCVDTCDLMNPGEGILAGCQSSGLFLIQAEVNENPYVEPRPFRVNAGPVSLYVLSSPTKTQYLSELKAGDEVLIVDRDGKIRSTNVARVKIERRPMILVEAEYEGKIIKTIVQNAETVRFVTHEGSRSVVELEVGNEILAHVVKGGRHFGTLVKEETVIER
jgi:3-dehydroquinate synthase II